MKITFVLDTADMAGGIRVVAIYADRLKKRGHEVTVISTPRRGSTLRQSFQSLRRGHGWPTRPPHRCASHLDAVDVDHRLLNRWRPIVNSDVPDGDVVIATWWETAEWVARLSPSKGAKAYLIQHHEVLFDDQPRERVAATWKMPLHKLVISKWLKDLAVGEYGRSDVTLIPNSVDTAQFHAPPRGRQRRPTVGMLYNTSASFKGCDVSLKAIDEVRSSFPGLRLISFGHQAPSPNLPLPPETTYVQAPAQDMIKDLYAQCDVWICGSHSEGFGLTVLEAMACRCPAVSTRVGGPIDFIQDGVNGHLVNVADAKGLAQGLRQVLGQSEQEWRAMSDAAYATATSYTWDDATTRLERTLHSLTRKQSEVVTYNVTDRGSFLPTH